MLSRERNGAVVLPWELRAEKRGEDRPMKNDLSLSLFGWSRERNMVSFSRMQCGRERRKMPPKNGRKGEKGNMRIFRPGGISSSLSAPWGRCEIGGENQIFRTEGSRIRRERKKNSTGCMIANRPCYLRGAKSEDWIISRRYAVGNKFRKPNWKNMQK